MVTWPKVRRVGLERSNTKLEGSGRKQSKRSRSGFLLLTLAIVCCWRKKTVGLDEVIDLFIHSFNQHLFIARLACGRSLPDSGFREGYQVGNTI